MNEVQCNRVDEYCAGCYHAMKHEFDKKNCLEDDFCDERGIHVKCMPVTDPKGKGAGS